jgi:hypothetical protein
MEKHQLTLREVELLAALEAARDQITGMGNHWGEGPPQADDAVLFQIQTALHHAQGGAYTLPDILPTYPNKFKVQAFGDYIFYAYLVNRGRSTYDRWGCIVEVSGSLAETNVSSGDLKTMGQAWDDRIAQERVRYEAYREQRKEMGLPV